MWWSNKSKNRKARRREKVQKTAEQKGCWVAVQIKAVEAELKCFVSMNQRQKTKDNLMWPLKNAPQHSHLCCAASRKVVQLFCLLIAQWDK